MLTLLAGCEEGPSAERPLQDHGEAPADALGAAVHAWGAETVARMEPREYLRGSLRRHHVSDHAQVLLGSHCYTFLGVAADGVSDLELILLDPAGTPLLRDTEEGTRAALGLREQVCPEEPGSYLLRVRAFEGEGDYAIRVYEYPLI